MKLRSKMSGQNIIAALLSSKQFYEGYQSSGHTCTCDRCKVSRYRHTSQPEICDYAHSYWLYLQYCISQVAVKGLWLEFGVGHGTTLGFIASAIFPQLIYGFDSFHGLPEDWQLSSNNTYTKGSYSLNGIAPAFSQANIQIVEGYFSGTLSSFLASHQGACAFVHIDCDLYSSTIEVLSTLCSAGRIVPGTILLFDELYNYDNYEAHEIKAWREVSACFNIQYEWIAHTASPVSWNGSQACLRILSIPGSNQ